jgi:hypothetical protein
MENDERVHHYQRGRTSITGFGLKLRQIIETGRLVVVVMTRLVLRSSLREAKVANKFIGITELVDAQLIFDDLSNDLPNLLIRPTSLLPQLMRLLCRRYVDKVSHSRWGKNPAAPKSKVR